MPVVLFLLGAATLALVASNAHAKKPALAPTSSPYRLDPHLDPRLRAQVEAALDHETDPAKLEAFASALAAQFPYAAWYLRAKAAAMRRPAPGPSRALPAASLPNGDGLDAHLPPSVRFNVIELLTMGTDPTVLETFAAELEAYPKAASALRLRAASLRSAGTTSGGRSSPASGLSTPSVSPPAPSAAASSAGGAGTPQGPLPTSLSLPGLDPGMPPELAMQVTSALLTENDPAKLRALGSTLQSSYPAAATLLFGKANALSPRPTPSTTPAPSPTPQVVPSVPPPAPQAAPPAQAPSATAPAPNPIPSAPPALPQLFDAGMSPEEQARVATALSVENDPTQLRQIADELGARYPKATRLLTNKADALQTLTLAATPAVLPSPPTVRARAYKVQAGDSPIRIARKHGRPDSAWKELVAANPQRPKRADGNFKTLQPGDVLQLPPSWSTPSPTHAAPAPATRS